MVALVVPVRVPVRAVLAVLAVPVVTALPPRRAAVNSAPRVDVAARVVPAVVPLTGPPVMVVPALRAVTVVLVVRARPVVTPVVSVVTVAARVPAVTVARRPERAPMVTAGTPAQPVTVVSAVTARSAPTEPTV